MGALNCLVETGWPHAYALSGNTLGRQMAAVRQMFIQQAI